MNKKQKLFLGSFIGMLIIFIIPIFPVPLPNRLGEFGGIWWNSGLMQVGLSLKSLFLLEGFGGIVGFIFTFISIGGFD